MPRRPLRSDIKLAKPGSGLNYSTTYETPSWVTPIYQARLPAGGPLACSWPASSALVLLGFCPAHRCSAACACVLWQARVACPDLRPPPVPFPCHKQVMASGMSNSTVRPDAPCQGYRRWARWGSGRACRGAGRAGWVREHEAAGGQDAPCRAGNLPACDSDPRAALLPALLPACRETSGLRIEGECGFVKVPAFGMLVFDWDRRQLSMQIRGGEGADGGRVLQQLTISLDTCQPV